MAVLISIVMCGVVDEIMNGCVDIIVMCGVVDVTPFGCVDIYRDVWCCRCNNEWLC